MLFFLIGKLLVLFLHIYMILLIAFSNTLQILEIIHDFSDLILNLLGVDLLFLTYNRFKLRIFGLYVILRLNLILLL